jgi:hypothetical protein
VTRTDALAQRPAPIRDAERERLQALFTRCIRERTVLDVGVLREAVCDFARQRRTDGARAEEVVVQLKQIIETTAGARDTEIKTSRQLAQSIVRWCIEEYYSPASPPRGD